MEGESKKKHHRRHSQGMLDKLIDAYLFFYYLACCHDWALVLRISLEHIRTHTYDTHYENVEFVLKAVQIAAMLEIIHAYLGFVRSPVDTTFEQVFSRVWTLWAVILVSVKKQRSAFLTAICTYRALVGVLRYLFYALNIVNAVPYPLFWLHHSFLAVLNPIGDLIVLAIDLLKGDHMWNEIPMINMILLAFIGLVIVAKARGRF